MSGARGGRGRTAIAVTVLAVGLCVAVSESVGDEFYRGKTLRIIVGFTAGGGFDTYARTLARHMGRHIPGTPTIVVENMPGAGSLITANHLYRVARPDGLTMGSFIGGLLLGQVLGQKGIEFDARKFEYVGSPTRDHVVCALTKASGITSLEKWMASPTPVKMGGNIPGASTPDNATRVLKTALGLPVQLVTGYKGTAEIRLAAEAGELAGACWGWSSVRATWRKGLDAGEVAVVIQAAPRSSPDLTGVPLAINLAKTPEARRLIEIAIHNDSAIARAYTLPPGTPKDRVQLLRKALLDTLRDPAFAAEAEKAKLDVDPVTAEEVEAVVEQLFKIEPAVVARLRAVLLD
jgi:tripartite-type tricarboxylate transporter receptor subunit TctC